MAVVLINRNVSKQYIGLSSDTKPTDTSVPVGSLFYCTDNKTVFIFNGTAWSDGTGVILFVIK